nr:hypothetical protein [Tanacetum cinerariifolium]
MIRERQSRQSMILMMLIFDLENRVKKLEEDFSRMLKANKTKEAKEAEEAELKVNKEVVQVSRDEGFFCDEDVVLFNDVK